ncbi:apolipoprotein N-acyltransferase [Streptacidiphilus pinicola]|uniref:apolipoprotein N-acyltransferase n=1 Tax=Streptacidiphilus pinicola TaxID=2219663 RepID=UPI001FB266D6|nr:apolipoprotein N-acyltransferase [Streptacidiphilus pinicola]
MPLTLESDDRSKDLAEAGVRPPRLVRIGTRIRRGLPRTALALLCGVLLALSFPSVGIWPLSLVAVAGLSLLTHGRTARQGAWTGLVLGLVFMLWLLIWIDVIGYDAWALLSVAEALFVALMGAGLAIVSRLRFWPLWTACLWVAQEWARDRVPLGGFPWGRLAFANTSSPFTPLAALGGAPLVSFAVALSGALLAAAVLALRTREGRERSGRLGLACAAGAVVAGVVGYAIPLPTAGTTAGGPAYAQIGVVQGNVPHAGMDFLGRPMQVLDNHVAATFDLMNKVDAGKLPQPQLVIWPENSSDVNPYNTPEAYAAIMQAAGRTGVPMLVGALVDGPDAQHVMNEGIVWDPKTGPGAHYTKQHPVPFGEYVPFRSILMKYITRLQRVARDFYPGDTTGILQVGPARIGDVICFEVAYDGIVHDAVAKGGRVLVVQTNNATYEHTDQPDQQFAMSRLRAIEHGRAVVIAATSGISAVIAPDGSVVQRTQLATQDELDVRVPLRDSLTLADRVGAAPEWALSLIGLGAVGFAVWTRRRRSGGDADSPAERSEATTA